jgi:hypothetical protein
MESNFTKFEGKSTEQLLMLARGVARCDYVDKGILCRAAIAIIDNPSKDEQLAAVADHLVQRCCDFTNFGGSRQSVAVAVLSYEMASVAPEVDDILHKRYQSAWRLKAAARTAARA